MKYDARETRFYFCSFVMGAAALSLISIPQKYILGADPFDLMGFIIPVLFGGSVGLILAASKRRIKAQASLGHEALRDSEEHFRLLFEKAPLPMAFIAMDGKILDLNDLLQETMGYAIEDVPTLEIAWNRSMPDPVLREEVTSQWRADIERAINENLAVGSFECPLIYKDGSKHNVVIGTRLIGENILVSFFDVTESTRGADAIDFERRQLLSIFNSLNDFIYVSDPTTYEILFANQRLRDLLGEDPTGSLCYKALQGLDQVCDFCTNPIILNNAGKPYTWEYRNENMKIDVAIVDQIIRWPDGRDVRLEIAVDVTEKKKMEEAYKASETKLRSIFEAMTDVILIIDPEGRLIEIAPTNLDPHNLSQDAIKKILDQTLEDVFSPEKADEIRDAISNALSLGRPTSLEYELTINGRNLCLESFFSRMSSDRVIMVTRNITDRKKAEKALQESEKRFRQIFQTSPESIILTRLDDGLIVDINESHTSITGYTREEVIGKTALESGIWQDEHERDKLITPLRESGFFKNKEITFLRKNGDMGTVLSSGRIFYLENVPHILTISRDVTEQKREQKEKEKLQARLQQAQKMEAIGTLAGGIAHDFNNILQGILGYTELAGLKYKNGKDIAKELEVLTQAGNRAADLVQNILSFSRQTEPERKPLDLGQVIKEALKLIRASLPATIEIRMNIPGAPDKVWADYTEMHQVLMNLCTNAAHAMEESGGILEVILEQAEIDDRSASMDPALTPGLYQRITVSDTGHGMDREVQSRIFDPFFTTKEQGKGTGMGMSVVHGIIKSHGGAITVYSEPGQGSTFHIFIPVMTSGSTECPQASQPADLAAGEEHILFVDDEKHIVDFASEILKALGYTVTGCNSSLEALELFSRDPSRFDLVITDQTMPRMTGVNLAGELTRLRPDIPIILCTGFSAALTPEKLKWSGVRELIMKPILVGQLAKTIRDVLDKAC